MLALLLERLRMHSVAKRGERWSEEANEIRGEFLAHHMRLEAEYKEAEAHRERMEAELAQVAEAMETMDYADAMQESFGGGPASGGESEGEGESQ